MLQFNDPWSLLILYPTSPEDPDPIGVPGDGSSPVAPPGTEASHPTHLTDEAAEKELANVPLLELRIDDVCNLSVIDELSSEESHSLINELDIFSADSGTLLKELLADYGIDCYFPVASIGNALPKKR